MADNISVKDASGATITIGTTDLGSSVHASKHRIVDASGNALPAMDAVGRRGYVTVTDGTNSMPTMDAVGRRGYVTVTDGTNSMPTMDSNARQGYVTLVGNTANNLSLYKKVDLGAVDAIKASAGVLYGLWILNQDGVDAYIQIFNVASGGVTLGTTVPDLEIYMPNAAATNHRDVFIPAVGIPFGTAITIASTTGTHGAVASGAGVKVYAIYK